MVYSAVSRCFRNIYTQLCVVYFELFVSMFGQNHSISIPVLVTCGVYSGTAVVVKKTKDRCSEAAGLMSSLEELPHTSGGYLRATLTPSNSHHLPA